MMAKNGSQCKILVFSSPYIPKTVTFNDSFCYERPRKEVENRPENRQNHNNVTLWVNWHQKTIRYLALKTLQRALYSFISLSLCLYILYSYFHNKFYVIIVIFLRSYSLPSLFFHWPHWPFDDLVILWNQCWKKNSPHARRRRREKTFVPLQSEQRY